MPVFCDVDPETFCVTRETVERALTDGTRAIVPVHLFGNLAPVDELRGARRAGARGRRAGDRRARAAAAARARSGDAATFSFFPSKNLACLGDGGAIVTDDDDVAELARRLRFHGSTRQGHLHRGGLQLAPRRAPGGRAARAAARARRLERARAARPRARTRRRASASTRRCRRVDGAEHVYHLYVVRHERRRRAGGSALAERGVGARGYYRAPGPPPAGDGRTRRRGVELPGTDGGRAHAPGAADGHRSSTREQVDEVVARVRVWVDLTNSPHVLVMRPLIEACARTGTRCEVTARDFAQTLELLERFGMEHTAIGRHRGGRLADKARRARVALAARWRAGRAGARLRRRDGPRLERRDGRGRGCCGIPSATAFDYEWATVQHTVNCRLARAVVVPEAIPPERLVPLRRAAASCAATPG